MAAWAIAGIVAAVSLTGFTHLVPRDTGLPPKWPPGTIPFRVTLGASTTLRDGSSFNTTALSAMQSWNSWVGSVQLEATFGPAGPGAEKNGVNEMFFSADIFGREFPAGAGAITLFNNNGHLIGESDIIFNTAFTWDSYRGTLRPPTIDLRRVALHELGHALGLGHADDSTPAIMNSRATSTIETLQQDDINGVQMIYGPRGKPVNDDFAQAWFITLAGGGGNSFELTGFNTNATKEPGEPAHAINSGPGQAINNGGRSIWWRWTVPTAGGSLALDTRGSYFDTLLAVYTGSSVSSLTKVTSNDDIEAGVIQASAVSLNVTGGTTYWIAVDGFNDDDGNGADSGHYTLNFAYSTNSLTPPAIATHPASATVTAGGSAAFSVTASGSAPLSYQWLLAGTAIAGANTSTYSIASAAASHAGTYSVTVSNSAGSVTSGGATLTVNPVPVSPPPPPPPSSGSGGGGGGGGAPSTWFCTALAVLGFVRFLRQSRRGL